MNYPWAEMWSPASSVSHILKVYDDNDQVLELECKTNELEFQCMKGEFMNWSFDHKRLKRFILALQQAERQLSKGIEK
jgi:hypothetical protein